MDLAIKFTDRSGDQPIGTYANVSDLQLWRIILYIYIYIYSITTADPLSMIAQRSSQTIHSHDRMERNEMIDLIATPQCPNT